MALFDIAQVCLNGHTINASMQGSPEFNQDCCSECGAKTTSKCESCNEPIRGECHFEELIIGGGTFTLPKFCHKCGKPYPWTVSKLKSAKELVEESGNLTPEEKKILKESMDKLVKNSPDVEASAVRFKTLMSKAGKATAEGIKNIITSIISESVRKLIFQN